MSDSQTTRKLPESYAVEAQTPASGPWAGMPGTDIPEYADLNIKPLPPGCPLDRMLTKWRPGNCLCVTYRGQSLAFRLAQAGEMSSKDLPENTYVAPPPPPFVPSCSPCATPDSTKDPEPTPYDPPLTDEQRIEVVAQENARYIINRDKVDARVKEILAAANPKKAPRKPRTAAKKPRTKK